jgi:hypothetical protein
MSDPKVVNAPERIYLVTGDLFGPDVEFSDLAEVTWCEDQQFDTDVPYVREDLHVAEVERLKRVRDAARAVLNAASAATWDAALQRLRATLEEA